MTAGRDGRVTRDGNSSPLIVIVSDDALLRAVTRASIARLEPTATIETFASGVEASELARKANIRVAVLELDMPTLDGVETAYTLRRLRPDVSLVFMTDDLMTSRASEARSFWGSIVLKKPILFSVLASALMRALSYRRPASGTMAKTTIAAELETKDVAAGKKP